MTWKMTDIISPTRCVQNCNPWIHLVTKMVKLWDSLKVMTCQVTPVTKIKCSALIEEGMICDNLAGRERIRSIRKTPAGLTWLLRLHTNGNRVDKKGGESQWDLHYIRFFLANCREAKSKTTQLLCSLHIPPDNFWRKKTFGGAY